MMAQFRLAFSKNSRLLFLHERSEELRHKRRSEKTVADQLVQAATVRPRKHRARNLRAQFQGHSARKDAEDSERNRWTKELADLLRGTQSPMGQFLASQPVNPLTEGGRRASTLRSRVRGVKRFLAWLALRYELTHPTALSQLTEYLQVRLQEPCSRCSHKKEHIARWCSWRIWPGVSPQDSFTDSPLYIVLYQENFSRQLCRAAQQSRRPESSQPCSLHWNTWSSARRPATIGLALGGS